MSNSRKPGRPREQDGPKPSIEVKVSHEMLAQIDATTDNRSGWAREILERYLNGELIETEKAGTDQMRLKFLTKAPAGDWREALAHTDEFHVLSKDDAEELDARLGDVVVRVDGQSMDGAGIHDGFLLLMRPVPERRTPKRGEIALVQIRRGEYDYESTIKFWCGGDPLPRLEDGAGNSFEFPEGVAEVRPVAVARGVLGRL